MAGTMEKAGAGSRKRKRRCNRKQGAAAGMSSETKVARLHERDVWPERTHRVDVVETHLSWVFLTTRHAWKLKKPGRYNAVDLRSVAARKRNCETELRLNRRLSPSVYLGVVPLTLCGDGVLRVGRSGKTVDWLLKMRRLPAGLMLDRALARGGVQGSDIARIVRRLSTFYRALPGAKMSGSAYHAHFLSEIARNESVLVRIMTRQSFDIRRLCGIQRAMLNAMLNRLELRVAHGWIRECHGDLRPEHVCLTRPIAIIDCLEFSERLRTIDTLDEVGAFSRANASAWAPPRSELAFSMRMPRRCTIPSMRACCISIKAFARPFEQGWPPPISSNPGSDVRGTGADVRWPICS